MNSEDVFDRLMQQVHDRVESLPQNSYTTKLLKGGVPKMGGKVIEEACEVLQASIQLRAIMDGQKILNETNEVADEAAVRKHLIYEAGDVLYHLWVLLGSFGISTDDLREELQRREGTSGLEEKRRRNETK